MTDDAIPELPPTIAQLPFFASGRFPKPDLLGQCSSAGIVHTSATELLERVRDLSLGLSAFGMARGDRVALLADNRPEWVFTDLAIQAAGAVTVPMYPTLSVEQVAFILRDSESTIAVASNKLLLEKLAAASAEAPSLKTLVVMDAPPSWSPSLPRPDLSVVSLAEVSARGHQQIVDSWGVARTFHDNAKTVRPDDLATIVYTSGTTGEPKGVMLTHGNIMSNVAGVRRVIALGPEDRGLSFLPLCHAFERTVVYFYLAQGVSIVFAESFNTIGRDLAQTKPTIVTGVPRIFERLQDRIVSKGLAQKGAKRHIFRWALGLASKHGRSLESGRGPSAWLRAQVKIADRLVFQRIRDVLGGRLVIAVSGGAPLPAELGRFFYGAGVPILEGYGLTETGPVLSVMPRAAIRFGTVGPALPNVEFRIAPDGEILARGPNIMAGYYKRPADTAEAIRDGWFHTGDIGALDENGYLRITDRKKALIITSAGKNVAPQPIEQAFRAHPLVAEVVLVGEQRPFMTLLIVPELSELAARLKWPSEEPPADFQTREDVRALYEEVVDAVNERLAQFEHVKRFAILPRAFSGESGELTPTLKVKRRVVEEKYRDVIERMYSL
jgi:long-chain acyl-CoA synthetase